MTANVEIVTGRVANAVRVPTTALRFRPKPGDRPQGSVPQGGQAVFVPAADPYKPARRNVRVGLQGEDFVEVTNGLRAGERVLVRAKSSVPTREFEEEGEPSNGD